MANENSVATENKESIAALMNVARENSSMPAERVMEHVTLPDWAERSTSLEPEIKRVWDGLPIEAKLIAYAWATSLEW